MGAALNGFVSDLYENGGMNASAGAYGLLRSPWDMLQGAYYGAAGFGSYLGQLSVDPGCTLSDTWDALRGFDALGALDGWMNNPEAIGSTIGQIGIGIGAARYANPASMRLGESGSQAVRRTLAQFGDDIPVPPGTQNIRTMMSDLSLSTGNEVALFRLQNGQRVIRMGGANYVNVGSDVARGIAHTHPSGRLALSHADVYTIQRLGGRSTVVIDPRANVSARISVNNPF